MTCRLFATATGSTESLLSDLIPAIVRQQRHFLALSREPRGESLANVLLAVKTRLCCSVCFEPIWDSEKMPVDKVIARLKQEFTDPSNCPCCDPSVSTSSFLSSLPRNYAFDSDSPWSCANSTTHANPSARIFCSKLCGSPLGTLLSCDTEDECADSTHGCIFCFQELGNVMQGDAGKWECVAGLDDDNDDDGFEDEDEEHEEDLFGEEEENIGDGFLAGLGLFGSVSSSPSSAKRSGNLKPQGLKESSEISNKRRRVANGDTVFVGEKYEEGDHISPVNIPEQRRNDPRDRWWSAAAKKCRERGSVSDECICGECDLYNELEAAQE